MNTAAGMFSEDLLNYADEVSDWFSDLGRIYFLRGDVESGLKATHVAACILSRQNRRLSSPRIEANLRLAGRLLAGFSSSRFQPDWKADSREVCLHVLTEALPAGGLTAMATRWIRSDRSQRTHCVALLSQRCPVPEELNRIVAGSGGRVFVSNHSDPLSARAVWLRQLAAGLASHVVLHVDVSDVISGAAFGVAGGPPVLLVNHSAHLFWTGASVVDLVLNCRGSLLEEHWTIVHRGVSRCAVLPIPLCDPMSPDSPSSRDTNSNADAKRQLGIPADATVLFTVGAAFKYTDCDGLDFVETCESLLGRLPGAVLLAAGFDADERWRAASRRLEGRIRVLGVLSQARLASVSEAADIYIEGFPFGTTTSLLEAGLRRIPCVLAPSECPPPYGSDGIAIDEVLERPESVGKYVERIVDLSKNPEKRRIAGRRLFQAISSHHAGSGWRRHLDEAISGLPEKHAVYSCAVPVPTPPAIYKYWSVFQTRLGTSYEWTLENAVMHALSMGLRPKVTKGIFDACGTWTAVRGRRTVPRWLLTWLCNGALPLLPSCMAQVIFRFFAFLLRGPLISQVLRGFSRIFRRAGNKRVPYQEYWHVRESSCPDACRNLTGERPRSAHETDQSTFAV